MASQRPISLQQLTDFLDPLSPSEICNPKVEQFFREQTLDYDELIPHIYFREDTYGRNLVHRKDHYELLVLSWLPDQATPIHDHNGQRCWMWIHSGKLTFRNYKKLSPKSSELVASGPPRIFQPGDLTYIDDKIGLHEIVNVSGKPAVSLHLYAQPISHCQVFNQEKKEFEWLELRAFNHSMPVDQEEPPSEDLLD